MTQPVVVVDAFTDQAFSGNSAAVCLLPGPRDERWMRLVAREMNLAETAFLEPRVDGYGLRWLTPTVEVDLCGHATLASAHVLWEDGHLPREQVARFHTRSGLLTAGWRAGLIELDFPADELVPASLPPDMAKALGAPGEWVGRGKLDFLVELDSERTVRTLEPDLTALARLGSRGIIVTSVATTAGFDFISRYFAPGSGIPEDPVTGSAHCTLAGYWGEKLGRRDMTGYQASARGGIVRVRREADRVILGGQAVTVLKGEILVGE